MTLKTDCLVEVYEGIENYQLGFQVCQAWKYKVLCHLKAAEFFTKSIHKASDVFMCRPRNYRVVGQENISGSNFCFIVAE